MGNRVTLQLRGGGEARIALPFSPTSPLVKEGLHALHAVLPVDSWWLVYSAWLAAEGAGGDGSAEQQWQALSQVVLRWAADPASLAGGPDGPPNLSGRTSSGAGATNGTTTGTTPVATPLRDADGGSAAAEEAWQRLLRSDYHRAEQARRRFAWAPPPRPPASQPDADGGAHVGMGPATRDEVFRALQALHSGEQID